MERKAYSTDLTDSQWQRLQACLPKARNGRTGRRKYPLHEVVDGLFSQLRTGCAWRTLLHDLPPWATGYDLCRRWRTDGTIEQWQHDSYEQVRKQEGREASPSAAVLDSQTRQWGRKRGPSGIIGYDANKKITRRS